MFVIGLIREPITANLKCYSLIINAFRFCPHISPFLVSVDSTVILLGVHAKYFCCHVYE